tara:strand:+ start:1744 stop:3126 length:1383 start_codon:yes stop_codon:yes gene_type:complete
MKYDNLKKFKNSFSNYTELRVQENRNNRLNLTNGDVTGNVCTRNSGVSARVFKDGNWGFSSSPEINNESIEQVVNASTSNVQFMNKKDSSKCGFFLPETQANYNMDLTTKKDRQSQKYWLDFVKEIDGYVEKKYPELLSRNLIMGGLDMEKSLFTSDGSESYSMTPRALLYAMLSIEKDGAPFSLGNPWGGLGQMEDKFIEPSNYFTEIDILVERLKEKANGVHADAGYKDVILDADLAGILAHEAIGHTTEADLVMGGSIAGDFIGKEVASPLVTLIDYANSCNGEVCPVPVYIDDEGTKSEDVVIIEDGILKRFMHNKDSARHFEEKPTGNARAYEFSDEPLIRMRNTAFVPGNNSLEEMISSIDDGYYLVKTGNGQADSTSEFMFAITMGYEIKNGKLGRAIKDTTISGIAFDVLKTVDMISSDMSWSSAGMCGKKQLIPVGMGGPAIKCKVNIGGR